MFHPSIEKAAVAPPLWPHGPEEATRILQACVVAWPSVACHGGVLAEGSRPNPNPNPLSHTRAHTHRHGGITCPQAPPRGLGAVNSPVGLVTGHPGMAAQLGPAWKAARTADWRSGEALTQPKPAPLLRTPQPNQR